MAEGDSKGSLIFFAPPALGLAGFSFPRIALFSPGQDSSAFPPVQRID